MKAREISNLLEKFTKGHTSTYQLKRYGWKQNNLTGEYQHPGYSKNHRILLGKGNFTHIGKGTFPDTDMEKYLDKFHGIKNKE